MPYVFQGTTEDVLAIFNFLKMKGFETEGPDFLYQEYPQITVDIARELSTKAVGKPFKEKQRIFVIVAGAITSEAQNALLKTLEEPPSGAFFVFVLPSPQLLLPTVKSRVHIHLLPTAIKKSTLDAKEFLHADMQARIDMLKELIGEDRDIRQIESFLSNLEKLGTHSAHLKPIYRARTFMYDKGALLKPLLEQVALLVPRA